MHSHLARVARRLKELRFNAGPVGAGMALADRPADTAVAAVIEVEQAIYKEYLVRDVAGPELAAGDWIPADAMEMAYGVQVMNPESGVGAAVFIADCLDSVCCSAVQPSTFWTGPYLKLTPEGRCPTRRQS